MKKLFNKFLAGAITIALVATLVMGVSFARNAKAEGTVSLGKWTFVQGGNYNPGEEANGNAGYINSVTNADSTETLSGWLKKSDASKNQTQSFANSSNGFNIDIDKTGWDRANEWTDTPWRINPFSIQAKVTSPMLEGHYYKVTFKAKASKRKNLMVDFNTVVNGQTMPPWDPEHGATMRDGSDPVYVELGTSYKSFTYIFDNFVNGTELTSTLMLGAFGDGGSDDNHPEYKNRLFDYGGNEITSLIQTEVAFTGQVQVSDFTVTDMGVNPVIPTDPPKPTTTAAPTTQAPTVTPQPTKAPETTKAPTPAPKKIAKVTGVKVKSVKKKTIKVTWKKAKNAKKYQIKVNNKTYNATKTSRKIKNKKFKKGKKVKVKVRGINGSKKGAWSKTVKKKITK